MTGDEDRIPALHASLDALTIAMRLWDGRDDTRAQPHVRHAANDAVDAIDAMLRDMYLLRGRLVGEIRASDDASAARADALLERVRDDGG